eukprot:TRINITY_DN6306_c0_g1_i5.p1 TRINITY_DN6306_c0_g1~~TRINITY_DN6306_c0_g1_i5.p1  ORF type:complete len:265 (-),score=52.38 TRINITY_DN6306_c0_g1_i5:100-894(-)
MPKYYCDYCDIFLTHDSPSVRKSHNEGFKHKSAVRTYYQTMEESHMQSIIDAKVKEFEEKTKLGIAPKKNQPSMPFSIPLEHVYGLPPFGPGPMSMPRGPFGMDMMGPEMGMNMNMPPGMMEMPGMGLPGIPHRGDNPNLPPHRMGNMGDMNLPPGMSPAMQPRGDMNMPPGMMGMNDIPGLGGGLSHRNNMDLPPGMSPAMQPRGDMNMPPGMMGMPIKDEGGRNNNFGHDMNVKREVEDGFDEGSKRMRMNENFDNSNVPEF